MKNKNNLIYIILPVVLAVVVLIVFAICGHISKINDEKNPTATTEVSVANPEETTTEAPIGKSTVELVAVGNNLIDNAVIEAGKQEDGSLDYSSIYANISKDISSADIAVISQETVMGGKSIEYSGYPLYNSPTQVADACISAGFDIFTCATNHILDKGTAAIDYQLAYFEKKKAVAIGINANENDNITYYKKNGITFAMLNYTYGTDSSSLPDDKSYYVNVLTKDRVTADIKEAKKNADVVVVFPHWSTESAVEVSDYQKQYAKLFADLKVDIVIGTNPHTLQPVKWVSSNDGKHKTLVYYSLGNFVSHQLQPEQLLGGMARIKITKNDDKISITSFQLVPLVTYYTKPEGSDTYQFSVYKLNDYTNSIAKTHSQSDATVKAFDEIVADKIDEDVLSLS